MVGLSLAAVTSCAFNGTLRYVQTTSCHECGMWQCGNVLSCLQVSIRGHEIRSARLEGGQPGL